MSRQHMYLERCDKPYAHEQHEWLLKVVSEDEQGDALVWVEPHLCLGHERIIALDIVDDDEQATYEPADAEQEARAERYDEPWHFAYQDSTLRGAHARGSRGQRWWWLVPAALGLTAAVLGGLALAGVTL